MLIPADSRLRNDLVKRAGCQFDKGREIRLGEPGAAFGDIRRDRNSGSTHLVGQPKPLVLGEWARNGVNKFLEINRFLPIRPVFQS